MKIFVAGATGAIGHPLVSQLVAEGHKVVGMVRIEENCRRLSEQGAKGIIADALDAGAVLAALARIRPEVVINQLTALPKHYTAEAMRAAQPVYRKLRTEGGANLEAAAQAAGIRRYILQSVAFLYAPGEGLATEDTPFTLDDSPHVVFYTRLYQEIEQHAFSLSNIEVVVLRYGFLYGPGTWYAREGDVADQVRRRQRPLVGDGQGVWSWVHVEDAARQPH
jgi:nucleoside-diphosphate-sugar epimerase